MVAAKTYEIIEGPRDREIFTAETFLAFLRLSNDHWWPPQASNDESSWIFRGHEDVSWKLIPSVARSANTSGYKAFFKGHKNLTSIVKKPDWMSAKRLRAAQTVYAYHTALREFKYLAEGLRLSPELQNTIDYKLADFVASGGETHMPVDGPDTLAQHHGVPTFLLDWSKRPEIAAYFASMEPKSGKQKNIAVFAILRTKTPIIEAGGHRKVYEFVEGSTFSNTFLHSQQGVFTKHADHMAFMKNGKIEPLEELIRTRARNYQYPLLKKIILEKKEVPRLRELLAREQLTKAHVMPTLDNVAHTVLSGLKVK